MIKKIQFEKYQATGNDFIIIDDRNNSFDLSQSEIESICHRRFGIGADGLILLQNSNIADFKMVYFNSDGKPGTFCGNGSRCIAMFAYKKGITGDKLKFEASDGLHFAEIIDDESVCVEMIDVNDITEFSDGYYLNTGSPHFIKIVQDLNEIDIYNEGKKISRENRFYTKSTNVNFIEVITNGLKIGTFERGVEDETYSCGTGAIAAAVVYNYAFEPDNKLFNIFAKGGLLKVSFNVDGKQYSNIKLSGKTLKVFEGSAFLKSI